MPRIPASRPGQSLRASAVNYGELTKRRKLPEERKPSRDWQETLWTFYDLVPEYRFACAWMGNMLSRATLTILKDNEPTEDAPAVEALESLFGGEDGQREMLRLLGIHFTVAGEAIILGSAGEGEDEWGVYPSVGAAWDQGQRLTKISGKDITALDIAIRLWKPHPRKTNDSDSPSRAIIPILSELVGLTKHVAAQIDSRLMSGGLLLLPTELEIPSRSVTREDPYNDGKEVSVELNGPDSFAQVLIDTASMAIEDRHSAAAMVPIVAQGPGEHLANVKHIPFWSKLDSNSVRLREEAIRRIALGMDMPPEALMPSDQSTSWKTRSVDESAIKIHAEPLLDVIVRGLTTGYLHPWLRSQGVEDYASYEFGTDTSQLRARPNRSKEAIELYDRGELSAEAMLRENGFDASDLMSNDERVGWLIRKVAGGTTTPDLVAEALRLLGVKVEAAVSSKPTEERPQRSLEEHPETRVEPDEKRSRRRVERIEDGEIVASAAPTQGQIDSVLLASEALVFRALERAGNRLKNRVGAKIGIPAADIYLSVPNLTLSEAEALLEDAWTPLERLSTDINREHLRLALQEYAITLLRLAKPHSVDALAAHLAVSMAASVQ